MYYLVSIQKTRKGYISKDLAENETPKTFQQGLKYLNSKGLAWIVYENDSILAYRIPKSFGFKSLGELMDDVAAKMHDMV